MSEFTEPAIITTFGMILGMIIFSQMNLRSYFKKEMFKTELQKTKRLNDIQLKKIARESGVSLSKTAAPPESDSSSGLLRSILPSLLESLSPEQTAALAEKFLPELGEDSGGDIGETLLQYAMQNPELVNKFLGGKKEDTSELAFEG